jgi:hypothetical protein
MNGEWGAPAPETDWISRKINHEGHEEHEGEEEKEEVDRFFHPL